MDAVAVAALASPVVVAEDAQPDGFETEVVQIPTRAGERLRGHLSFPTRGGVRLPGPFPVVLEYSPYRDPASKALWTSNGYVYAGVQVPGACRSVPRTDARSRRRGLALMVSSCSSSSP